MKLPDDFEIDLLFPDDNTDFIAEICYQEQFVCLISQEQGFDHLEIEIDPAFIKRKLNIPLSGFLDVIAFAKRRLWDLRKDEAV